ncbi:hypothetical protein BOX15_Mlig025467g1 [Macrostomum lignano]|uniref:Uncharacterized protein n=1 Tax=Macrostomum lignano TaxID=282301 RepID=A0A267FWS1_9PLAT|nr:hypothetical protein BOX15_Mlig031744g1 [Macrostomum lignano]PAA78285.1 hypothetical protein BOX15_Mlig025467g1 [Macrostomum lignano]
MTSWPTSLTFLSPSARHGEAVSNKNHQERQHRKRRSRPSESSVRQPDLETDSERFRFYLLKLSDVMPDSFLIRLPGIRIVSSQDPMLSETMRLVLQFGRRFSRDYVRVHVLCQLVHLLVCEDSFGGRYFGSVDSATVADHYWTGVLSVQLRRIHGLPAIL